MALVINLALLCFVGCNAGVVRQHFMSNHTGTVHAELERVPINSDKNESNSSLVIVEKEISNTDVGGEDHNSSEVSKAVFHDVSEELNLTKLNVSKESHPFVNNHSKELDHSRKGDTKVSILSSRSRKKSKGFNRFKKSTSIETKNFEKVTKGHVKKVSLNESHHSDFERELSHPVVDFAKVSDHAENVMKDNFKESLNGSHHTNDFIKRSTHFDKNVSREPDHVLNATKIDFNQHEISGYNPADEIVTDFNLLNNVLNESHNQENVFNYSHFDESFDFENVTKPVLQVEQNNTSRRFENKTRSETVFDTIIDFRHFDSTSDILDATVESSSNFLNISNDQRNFKELHHLDNISDSINNLHHDPLDMNSFREDNIHNIDVHSEKTTSEMNPLIESLNSSEIDDTERRNTSSTKENSSHPHKEDRHSNFNHHFNETNTNDAYVLFTVSPNDTNSSTELLRVLEINSNESKLITGTNDSSIMAVEENGLFSGISFLLNSELAKNAASAIEVFNLTDSALTDHIMDNKNDVHDFLDLIHPSVEFHGNMNMRENLNPIVPELNSSVVSSLPQTFININFETTTAPQPMLNSTSEFEETTTIVSLFNSTVEFIEAICPPPGICIFWFLAQDTCAVNSHCLGSRICCRIGCAKTCIEV